MFEADSDLNDGREEEEVEDSRGLGSIVLVVAERRARRGRRNVGEREVFGQAARNL